MSSDLQHYYDRKGSPVYDVPNKSKGGVRPVTIRDARQMLLAPGVSNVDGIIANYGIQRYQLHQLKMALATEPRREVWASGSGSIDEPVDDWVARAEQEAKRHSEEASARGTEIHGEVSTALRTSFTAHSPAARSIQEAIEERFGTVVRPTIPTPGEWKIEHSFCSPLGYGGTIDLWIPGVHIVDYKTVEGLAEKKKTPVYPAHCRQLAAYSMGVETEPLPVPCSNLIVDRDTGEYRWHDWTEEELVRGWQMFRLALKLWALEKNYDPSWDPEEEEK